MVWWGRLQPFNPSSARTSLSRFAPTATCSAHPAAGAAGGNHGDENSCGAIFHRATAAPHGVGAVEHVGTRVDLAKGPRKNNFTFAYWPRDAGTRACRVPTHRDARRTCTKARPDESGRGRLRVRLRVRATSAL